MTLPNRRTGQQIPPAVLGAARELVEPVRRSVESAIKRLQRRLRDDPEMRDVPVEILTAAVLDLLAPVIKQDLISVLLEDAQAQHGKIWTREWMAYLTGVSSRQAVEQKYGLIKRPGKRSAKIPEPSDAPDHAILQADTGALSP